MNVEQRQLVDWFGEDILKKPPKRRRRSKTEIMESHRVKCKKCGHSWIHFHSDDI